MNAAARMATGLLTASLCVHAVVAQAEVRDAIRPGVTTLTDRSPKGTEVRASVTVDRLDKRNSGLHGYWGVDEGVPASVVTALTIRVGKDTVDVPFTAWADLGEPRSLRLTVGAQGATLILEGGETSTHYVASWVVLNRMLYKRRVEMSAADVWEETVYSWNTLDTNDF